MTKIEWTEKTWNPVIGCSKVSPGCQNCYAVTMAKRIEAMGNSDYVGMTVKHPNGVTDWPRMESLGNTIDWVVCGGESSPNARPMNPDWARGLRDQCKEANVPFFFKQWGGVVKSRTGRLLDGVEHNEYPYGRTRGCV